MKNTIGDNKLVGLVKVGLVAALYVVITLTVAPFAYGPVQFRLSELFNNLSVFNKRYIWAVTIGCAIANLNSPLGMPDVIFGTLGTLLMTSISYWLSRYIKKTSIKLGVCVAVCTLMSWTVALELMLISKLPFWASYLSVGAGELVSMVIGAIIVYLVSKRIDLTK